MINRSRPAFRSRRMVVVMCVVGASLVGVTQIGAQEYDHVDPPVPPALGPPPFGRSEGAPPPASDTDPLTEVVSSRGFVPYAERDADAWAAAVPQAQAVVIPGADGGMQLAYWVPPIGPDRPLLVALHSWSTTYDQQLTIPYARWAVENGWGLIAPDFGGINDGPDATGSDRAVGDVVAAVDWAVGAGVADPDGVVATGYSGGGMMTLLVTSRHPERFAAAIAWGPVVDLPSWYAWTVAHHPDRRYVADIRASCGGPPEPGTRAEEECTARSPIHHLRTAAQRVPTYIGVGVHDDIVPIEQGVAAFNAIAHPADRIDHGDLSALVTGRTPVGFDAEPGVAAFDGDDPPLVATRQSRGVTLVAFDGVHEMLYGPTIEWLDQVAVTR